MAKRLSFSIAINLLTENFKKGTNTVKNSLRSIQMQVLTFAAALGVGSLGLSGLLSRFKDVARETNRVLTALKNVSDGTRGFADSLRFVNDMADKYGLKINSLVGNFAKFTASASQANMPMDQQRKVFESLARASTAFGLSASDTNGVFLALSQMMGKGKISSEELRKQIGERIPIAMQAMAKAAGVSMAGLEKLLKQGKLLSSEIIPKFADALNEMIPNVDTDNLESSLNRLSNTMNDIVNASGFQSKYKVLIDWLNSTLQTAAQNIQNIVVGIMAAIAFVITSASTKVLKGWWYLASEMTTGQEKLNAELTKTTASRVAAENALETARLKHSVAIGNARIKLAQDVALKEKLFARAVLAEDRARLAAENANTGKRVGIVTKGFNTIKIGAAKLVVTLKSLWNTFYPAIIISGLIAIGGYFKNLYSEAKRIKNIFADYKKEAKNVSNTQEVKMLQAQLAIMNDKTKSQKEINAAQAALQKMLGKEKLSQEEINKVVAKRIELLKEAARADFYAHKAVEVERKIESNASSIGLSEDQVRELAEKREKEGATSDYYYQIGRAYDANGVKGVYDASKADKIIKETVEDLKVLAHAEEQLKNAVTFANQNTTFTDDGLDDKALRAAEKRLEALRKLDQEDRKRQLDKQKFDLDLQQKTIDLLDDSFEKRTKQTLLNLKKEELEIAEFGNALLKQQEEHLKTEYQSKHGTNDGFGKSYENLSPYKLQNILPEGLRPSDIADKVKALTDAAKAAQEKGLKDINSDLSRSLRDQELMFASSLDKRLSEIDTYYNEQLIKAVNNAELIEQIEANRKREKLGATTDDRIEELNFREQLENERAAGLESIGMTELVEEKKLELTRKYLELRIEALQELADAGDEDAIKQISLYQQQIKKLDLTKPAKSLKSLADKAIFNRIKEGFEKAGDSAEEADEKTIRLLSSITEKAALIANITSEMQSMFGGLDEGLDEALSAVGNIASGFAQGGLIGGVMAVIGEGMKLFSKASEASARHQKALKEIEDARNASQRAYNLLLLEQNLLLEEAESIFGDKQITRAANAINTYRDSMVKLQEEMQGDFKPNEAYEKALEKGASSGGIMESYFAKQLSDYRKQVDNYNKGIAKLSEQQMVTGHKKTGMFGWGKGKDVYGSILDSYPQIIKANGEIDKGVLQIVLDTEKLSDETRNYLENLIELQNFAETAQEELRNYLQSTFGSLGDDMMTSLENAIKDRGVNAWEEFGKAGAKVIEELGKQLAYELFFAEKFKDLQKQLETVYGSDKDSEVIAREAMDVVGKFYKNIGSQMELAQGFMENWQKEAEKYGLSLWESEASTQDSTKGFSVSMDQDTGGAILGRITGMQECMLEIKSMMSAIQFDGSKYQTQSVFIGDELKKHTGILYEMQQMQHKTYRMNEKMNDGITSLLDIKDDLSSINKNTKGLAPR